jgi:hypothetical protein
METALAILVLAGLAASVAIIVLFALLMVKMLREM